MARFLDAGQPDGEARPLGTWFVLGIGCLFRLWHMSDGLWYDEILYATSYRQDSLAEILSFIVERPPAPIFTVLMFFWRELLGESEWTVRLPALLAGLAAIPLCYKLARTCCDRWTATLASLMLCLSPAHIWYSQDASPHTIAGTLMLLALFAFSKRRIFPRARRWWALYTCALFGCVFTHYLYVLLLAPLSLLALWEQRAVLWRIVVSHALVFLPFVGMLLLKLSQGTFSGGMGHLRAFGPFEAWMVFFNWFAHGNCFSGLYPYGLQPEALLQLPWLLAIQVGVLLVFVRGLVRFWRRARKRRGREILACLPAIPLLLWMFGWLGMDQLYIERYLLQTLPLFLIFLALGVSFSHNKAWRVLGTVLLLAFGLASTIALETQTRRWTVFEPKSDWRGAVRYLSQRRGVVLGQLTNIEATPIRYYEQQIASLSGEAATVSGSPKWIHVIKSPVWTDPLFGSRQRGTYKLKQEVEATGNYRLTATRSFGGVDIWTYRWRH